MCVFYDKDCDFLIIQGKKVVIIGYGFQGYVYVCNLKDFGVDVIVGLCSGFVIVVKVEVYGLKVVDVKIVVVVVDVVMIFILDEFQGCLYKEEIELNLKKGVILVFVYGFFIYYNQVVLCVDFDVIMIVLKVLGYIVCFEFVKGGGIFDLIVIYQDVFGNVKNVVLFYVCGVGGGCIGIIEIIFKDEIEIDLFGEQVVFCGGCVELVKVGFEILVEVGYVLEMVYFECLYELKLIVDLMYEGGIVNMNYFIFNNVEYGEYVIGLEVINVEFCVVMCNVLKCIQDGEYVKMFIIEGVVNYLLMIVYCCNNVVYLIEQIGEKLCVMMLWIVVNKIVDKSKN